MIAAACGAGRESRLSLAGAVSQLLLVKLLDTFAASDNAMTALIAHVVISEDFDLLRNAFQPLIARRVSRVERAVLEFLAQLAAQSEDGHTLAMFALDALQPVLARNAPKAVNAGNLLLFDFLDENSKHLLSLVFFFWKKLLNIKGHNDSGRSLMR